MFKNRWSWQQRGWLVGYIVTGDFAAPFYSSALTVRACYRITLSTLASECIQKQHRYDVVKQLMVEQSLNQKHPDLNRTAQTSVQIYKGGTIVQTPGDFLINRFVWNRSLWPGQPSPVTLGSAIWKWCSESTEEYLWGQAQFCLQTELYDVLTQTENDSQACWAGWCWGHPLSIQDTAGIPCGGVYPQIIKINAGDRAWPGNVGMQRPGWDQIGGSHAVKIKFIYGPI